MRRGDADEARHLAASAERLDVPVEVEIGQAVGVVGKEHLLALQMRANTHQSLADVRVQPRIDERDAPILDVFSKELDRATAVRVDEIVEDALVVFEKEVLDRRPAVAQAQDEVLVAEVGVVLHQVPQDGPGADLDERLRDHVRVLAKPHAETAAEKNDFHSLLTTDRTQFAKGDRRGVARHRQTGHARTPRERRQSHRRCDRCPRPDASSSRPARA